MSAIADRLNDLSVRRLWKLAAVLNGGSLGFDPARDERTNTKAKLVPFIEHGLLPKVAHGDPLGTIDYALRTDDLPSAPRHTPEPEPEEPPHAAPDSANALEAYIVSLIEKHALRAVLKAIEQQKGDRK